MKRLIQVVIIIAFIAAMVPSKTYSGSAGIFNDLPLEEFIAAYDEIY